MSKAEEIYCQTLIKWVNCYLAPSKIDGIGVFAIRDIKEGEKLYLGATPHPFTVSYKKLQNNLPAYIHDTIVQRWPLVKKGSSFPYPDAVYVAYMNHSDKPNYDAVNDVALKDIAKGEEITEDYKKIDGWEELYPWLKDS